MKKNKLIIANWKMNGILDKVTEDFVIYVDDKHTNCNNIIFAVPNIFLYQIDKVIQNTNAKFNLATQDISIYKDFGSYTGEISGKMLSSINVKYAIIGHSERRAMGEDDGVILNKLNATIYANLVPIYCIGENLIERNLNNYLLTLRHQLDLLLKLEQLPREIIIAYEPIWSIGSGLTPDNANIEEVIIFIKEYINKNFKRMITSVLYGGSVNSKNAKDILSIKLVDGVLVGGGSLNSVEFIKICSALVPN